MYFSKENIIFKNNSFNIIHMNKADIYYGFQFINNYFPDSYYINTINDCIKEDLIISPLESDKSLFIY